MADSKKLMWYFQELEDGTVRVRNVQGDQPFRFVLSREAFDAFRAMNVHIDFVPDPLPASHMD